MRRALRSLEKLLRVKEGAAITHRVIGVLDIGEQSAMNELKLIALDAEDLAVISAHLQDAVVRVGDLDYDPRAKRVACVVNRFDWMGASNHRGVMKSYERRRAGVRIEHVLSVRTFKIDMSKTDEVLSLMAISFAKGEAPDGLIKLFFSGGAEIELTVECIEMELRDLGAAWTTHAKPVHRTDDKGT